MLFVWMQARTVEGDLVQFGGIRKIKLFLCYAIEKIACVRVCV